MEFKIENWGSKFIKKYEMDYYFFNIIYIIIKFRKFFLIFIKKMNIIIPYVFFIVCLLSVLFLLPYCGRGHAPLLLGLGGMWLATYSCLVLPVLISANYKYPVRWLRNIILYLPGKLYLIFFYMNWQKKNLSNTLIENCL